VTDAELEAIEERALGWHAETCLFDTPSARCGARCSDRFALVAEVRRLQAEVNARRERKMVAETLTAEVLTLEAERDAARREAERLRADALGRQERLEQIAAERDEARHAVAALLRAARAAEALIDDLPSGYDMTRVAVVEAMDALQEVRAALPSARAPR
jgi:FtsZ-binding cell division protein ZapB